MGEMTEQAARLHRRHLQQRQAPAVPDQRHPRPVQGGGGQDDARPRAGAGVLALREQPLHHPGEGRRSPHPPRAWMLAEELGSIQADARKVKQIVYNLLSNAVKFTLEGGQVTLRAPSRPARRGRAPVGPVDGAELSARRQRVRGVSRDQRHRHRHRHLAGGARAAVQAVQLRSTAAWRESSRARASAWPWSSSSPSCTAARWRWRARWARAPASRSGCRSGHADDEVTVLRADPSRRMPKASSRRSGAPTALVVEDDAKSAELIRVQLEAEGFKVLHAASAEAALALAVEQPLSLITLDIMLPNMDGWEFLGRLKQMPALARIPVVIISIVADQQQGLRARRRGGHAEAHLPAGALRVARRTRSLPCRTGRDAQGPGGRRRSQGGRAHRGPDPGPRQHRASRVRRSARPSTSRGGSSQT